MPKIIVSKELTACTLAILLPCWMIVVIASGILHGQSNEPSGDVFQAAFRGDVSSLQALLNSGVDANQIAATGETPLMFASIKGHVDAVRLLLSKGADVNAKRSSDGFTALMFASQNGHLDVVQALLRASPWWNPFTKRIDVNTTSTSGQTALMAACSNGHREVVEVLLDRGADVNARRNDGETALMFASSEGHIEVVQILVRRGADVNAKSATGSTALTHAASQGNTAIVKALVARGADVNTRRYGDGSTALLLAYKQGHSDVAKVLLDHGATLAARSGCDSMLLVSNTLVSIEGNLLSLEDMNKNKVVTMYTDDKTLFCKNGKRVSSIAQFGDRVGKIVTARQNHCLSGDDAAGHPYVFRLDDAGGILTVDQGGNKYVVHTDDACR